LKRALPDILAIPSLQNLVFSHYHRYEYESYFSEGRDRDLGLVELISGFWEVFRTELDKHKDKPLKIKYHKKEDSKVEEKLESFKRIFAGLPPGQTFEYDVAWINDEDDEEEEEEEEREDVP